MSLRTLASELETTDRTLRRALRQGTLRGTRPSARKLDLPLAERVYLRRAWPLLSELREALRTEPTVGLAVLFGSRGRGDERSDSDVDLVVALRDSSASRDLASRLSERVRLRIHIVSLDEAESAPLLLAAIVRDGRVLVDRQSIWPVLMSRKTRILRAAASERSRVDREFAEAFPTPEAR